MLSADIATNTPVTEDTAFRIASITKTITAITVMQQYVFYKQSMRCKRAKRNARRVTKTRGSWRPKNFKCTSGSGFRNGGHCRHHHRNKLFGWHPFD